MNTKLLKNADKMAQRLLKNAVPSIDERTFLISDTHFAHKAVLEKEPSRLEMAAQHGYRDFYDYLFHAWNQRVCVNERVLHLGDLYYRGGLEMVEHLNGQKTLLVGNNDIGKFEALREFGKAKRWGVCDFIALDFDGREYVAQMLARRFEKERFRDPYLAAIVCDVVIASDAQHRVAINSAEQRRHAKDGAQSVIASRPQDGVAINSAEQRRHTKDGFDKWIATTFATQKSRNDDAKAHPNATTRNDDSAESSNATPLNDDSTAQPNTIRERILFSHFPVFNRKKNDRFNAARDVLEALFAIAECTLNIHGHIHSRSSGNDFCLNASVEAIGFAPVRLGELVLKHRYGR